ncbi:TetR/AcrR family transcriptional regulator [Embleya scabrispora]|uniref:TetR/AcrR family transcriptional regulator n=1 Tax=Embleya scabrispora TaxID=159449 RepID=UPI00068E3BD9|nr:TetR/AcrR family transcriptional regulator [Embleya scabrispora]MYS85745.1 TetR family transcriptional regulator [Streptomyces sp. SID5474]
MPREGGAREAGAQRTRQALLTAAAQVFVEQGVNAPIRAIAGRAQVGLGTVYRHFPHRAELVIAVYRHQIDECVALAIELAGSPEPRNALSRWTDAFVEFLVTKHGLGAALQSDDAGLHTLHSLMLDKLVPACGLLIDAAVARGQLDPRLNAYVLMRAVGNLCILGPGYEREDARAMVARLLAGCRPDASPTSVVDSEQAPL